MIVTELKSPAEAEKEIARVFQAAMSINSNECTISVRDDGAFIEDGWLSLGTVRLALPELGAGKPTDEADLVTELVGLGAFEWCTPALEGAHNELLKALDLEKNSPGGAIDAVLSDVSSIGMRAGLLHPIFDPDALEDMPYNRSTTIVVDTSGVLQGALDFIVRHLHPAARVKIPAIVHLEIVGAADNFLSLRRLGKKKGVRRLRELTEHLNSQGGQRALLRMELHADTEIERTFLFGDPLRDAFKTDSDNDVAGLNISVPLKSYVDRLILEAARHHQAQSGPAHKVRLLTGDQGLARMALAEGIAPLYFSSTRTEQFFGVRLTGRTFDPFTGAVQNISLAAVLWELATAFGSARLENEDAKRTFTISALGKQLSWSPVSFRG